MHPTTQEPSAQLPQPLPQATSQPTDIERAVSLIMRALSTVSEDGPLFSEDCDDAARDLYEARRLCDKSEESDASMRIALASLGDDFAILTESRDGIARDLAEALKSLRRTN